MKTILQLIITITSLLVVTINSAAVINYSTDPILYGLSPFQQEIVTFTFTTDVATTAIYFDVFGPTAVSAMRTTLSNTSSNVFTHTMILVEFTLYGLPLRLEFFDAPSGGVSTSNITYDPQPAPYSVTTNVSILQQYIGVSYLPGEFDMGPYCEYTLVYQVFNEKVGISEIYNFDKPAPSNYPINMYGNEYQISSTNFSKTYALQLKGYTSDNITQLTFYNYFGTNINQLVTGLICPPYNPPNAYYNLQLLVSVIEPVVFASFQGQTSYGILYLYRNASDTTGLANRIAKPTIFNYNNNTFFFRSEKMASSIQEFIFSLQRYPTNLTSTAITLYSPPSNETFNVTLRPLSIDQTFPYNVPFQNPYASIIDEINKVGIMVEIEMGWQPSEISSITFKCSTFWVRDKSIRYGTQIYRKILNIATRSARSNDLTITFNFLNGYTILTTVALRNSVYNITNLSQNVIAPFTEVKVVQKSNIENYYQLRASFSTIPLGTIPSTLVYTRLNLVPTIPFTTQVEITKADGTAFPYQFQGSRYQAIHFRKSYVPFDFYSNSMSLSIGPTQLIPIDANAWNSETDLQSPMVQVQLVQNTNNIGNYFLMNIQDALGIRDNWCNITFGPVSMSVKSSNRIKGSVYDGSYLLPIPGEWKPYYCMIRPSITCQDIRGNGFFDNVADENNLVTPFQFPSYPTLCPIESNIQSRVVHIGYKFTDNNTVQFSVVLFAPYTINIPTLVLYNDFENSQFDRLIVLTPFVSGNRLIEYSGTSQLVYPVTSTRYFGLMYGENGGPTKTFSTADINYHLSLSSPASDSISVLPSSNITILNSNYKELPSIQLQYSSGFISLFFESSPDKAPIKNITLAQLFNQAFYPIRYQWSNSSSSSNQIEIQTANGCGSNSRVYLESACDDFENCYQFGMFGIWVDIGNVSEPCTSVTLDYNVESINVSMSLASNNQSSLIVDVASNERTFDVILRVDKNSNNFQLVYNQTTPILYLTEKISNEKIEFVTTPTGVTDQFKATVEIPVNWGLRGVYISLWRVLDNYGGVFGVNDINFNLTLISSSLNNQLPNIWNTSYSNLLKRIIIGGSNFGYSFESFVNDNRVTNYVAIGVDSVYIDISPFNIDYSMPITFKSGTYSNVFTGIPGQKCPRNCSGHGDCVAGECICASTWTGEDCSIDNSYTCPNSCSGNGQCIDRLCNCNSNFTGPDCSISLATSAPTNFTIKVDATAPTATFSDFFVPSSSQSSDVQPLSVNYEISLKSIEEIDFFGEVVATYDLSSLWQLVEQNENYTLYNISSGFQTGNPSSWITVTIHTFGENGGSIQWMNNTVTMPPRSIKFFTYINGYSFGQPYNQINLVWEGVTEEAEDSCADNNVDIGGNEDDMHWFLFKYMNLNLYGRFSDSILLNQSPIRSSNKITQTETSVTVRTILPYFDNVLIDPDFSVLVDYSNDNNNECEDTKFPTWKIAVIVVAGVIFIGAAIVGIKLLVQKNLYIRTRVKKITMKRM